MNRIKKLRQEKGVSSRFSKISGVAWRMMKVDDRAWVMRHEGNAT